MFWFEKDFIFVCLANEGAEGFRMNDRRWERSVIKHSLLISTRIVHVQQINKEIGAVIPMFYLSRVSYKIAYQLLMSWTLSDINGQRISDIFLETQVPFTQPKYISDAYFRRYIYWYNQCSTHGKLLCQYCSPGTTNTTCIIYPTSASRVQTNMPYLIPTVQQTRVSFCVYAQSIRDDVTL